MWGGFWCCVRLLYCDLVVIVSSHENSLSKVGVLLLTSILWRELGSLAPQRFATALFLVIVLVKCISPCFLDKFLCWLLTSTTRLEELLGYDPTIKLTFTFRRSPELCGELDKWGMKLAYIQGVYNHPSRRWRLNSGPPKKLDLIPCQA